MNRRNLWAVALGLLLAGPGCIGLRHNTDNFLNDPDPGMAVVEMLKEYGSPTFSTTVGDQTVFVYRVNDDGYYVLFGKSNSFDLVVVCQGGAVVETRRVKVGTNMAILQPATWQVN